MKFLVDENVPIEISWALRKAGHQVEISTEQVGKQASDAAVWAHAVKAEAIVVTCNRGDFLELAGSGPSTGLIILNRRRTRIAEVAKLVKLISSAGPDGLMNNINLA